MYLWCVKCNHAHLRSSWEVKGTKYGVCPTCGCSEYRNGYEWLDIAEANNYPLEPNNREVYLLQPVLFNLDNRHIIK